MTDKTPTDLIAETLAEHRLMFWTIEHVWGETKDGSRTAPRCSCGVLRSGGGVSEDLASQVAWWEAHLAAALAAVLPATPPDTHAAVRAAVDRRIGETLFRAGTAAPVAAEPALRCTRCGLTTKAANAGVLCDPPFAGTHDFAALVAADTETAARCWRGECRTGCYYPDACSEAAPAVSADTPTIPLGHERLCQAMIESATEYDWTELPDNLADQLRVWADDFTQWTEKEETP